VHYGGAAAGNLVGAHRHADARAADQHHAVHLVFHQQVAGAGREVRVVDAVLGEGAQVVHFVTRLFQEAHHLFLHLDGGVVGGNGDLHRLSPSAGENSFSNSASNAASAASTRAVRASSETRCARTCAAISR